MFDLGPWLEIASTDRSLENRKMRPLPSSQAMHALVKQNLKKSKRRLYWCRSFIEENREVKVETQCVDRLLSTYRTVTILNAFASSKVVEFEFKHLFAPPPGQICLKDYLRARDLLLWNVGKRCAIETCKDDSHFSSSDLSAASSILSTFFRLFKLNAPFRQADRNFWKAGRVSPDSWDAMLTTSRAI